MKCESPGGKIGFQLSAVHTYQTNKLYNDHINPFDRHTPKGKLSCSPISKCCAVYCHCQQVQLIFQQTKMRRFQALCKSCKQKPWLVFDVGLWSMCRVFRLSLPTRNKAKSHTCTMNADCGRLLCYLLVLETHKVAVKVKLILRLLTHVVRGHRSHTAVMFKVSQ